MIKMTIRYPDESEWAHFLRIFGPYIAKSKPRLPDPGRKGPNSDHYRREIWLKIPDTKPKKPDS